MRGQLARKAHRLAVGTEALVDVARADPPAALGKPHAGLEDPSQGRTSLRYSCSTSTAQGITVATLRRRGGLPRIALPKRTDSMPKRPSSEAAGLVEKSVVSSIAASRRRSPQA